MEIVDVRKVTLNDIEQLQLIGKQTFFETFSAKNTHENMQKYLEQSFSIERLKNEILDVDSIFYFAFSNKQVVGYMKLNFGIAQTELKDNKALEIERIYVLKSFHGKGVGQALYEKAIQVANQENMEYVWLGVWEDNARARSFYRKNGFVDFDKHVFKLGDDEQTDIMMKRQMKK